MEPVKSAKDLSRLLISIIKRYYTYSSPQTSARKKENYARVLRRLHSCEYGRARPLVANRYVSRMVRRRHCPLQQSSTTYNGKHDWAFGEDDRSRSTIPCNHRGYLVDAIRSYCLGKMDWHFPRERFGRRDFSRASPRHPPFYLFTLALLYETFYGQL